MESLWRRGLHKPAGAVRHDDFIPAVAPFHLCAELLFQNRRQRLKDFHSKIKLVRGVDNHDGPTPALGLLSECPQDERLQRHGLTVLACNRNQRPPANEVSVLVMLQLPVKGDPLPRHQVHAH